MEVGEKDGRTVILEEYVTGDTLGEILQGGLLTNAEAKQICRQLCAALWVLHSMGVVHRDVKPDNVIIRGKDAVLIDFDASRIYKNANQRRHEDSGDDRIRGTGAIWPFAVRRTCGYLCARCLTEYYADRRASIKKACRWQDGQNRSEMYDGKSRKKI